MKKLFLSLVAVMVATMSYAQSMLVATLSHGDDVSMYYGLYALRDAHNAAQSGDVINLSGGSFQAVNITKAVALRGTGIDDANPTYITNDFTINIPQADTCRLSMEGIRSTGTITMEGTFNSLCFLKCRLNSINYDGNAAIKNAMFANCWIGGPYSLRGSSTVQFVNSYILGFSNVNQTETAAFFINCVIRPYYFYNSTSYNHDLYDYNNIYLDRAAHPNYIINSQLLNCIIYYYNKENSNVQQNQLPSSTIAQNCVSIGFSNLFGSQPANTGNKSTTFTELFKDCTGSAATGTTFELTDEAKTTFLGSDRTEVGIHGGMLPYDTTPSYPQITKMNVANRTTADGKLSVEIEVSAAE